MRARRWFQTASLILGGLLLVMGTAKADDRSEIRRLVAIPGQVIDAVRIAGGWAVAEGHVVKGEGGGSTILCKMDGVWRVVHGGGGARLGGAPLPSWRPPGRAARTDRAKLVRA